MENNFKMDISIDIGNSNVKAFVETNGIVDLVFQPTTFSRIDRVPNLEEVNFDSFISNIFDRMIVSIMSDKINGMYYVGNYALKSNTTAHSIDVTYNDKSNSQHAVVLPLSIIAANAVLKAYEDGKNLDNISVFVEMTSQLPINQYSKERAKAFISQFSNKNIVKVYLPNTVSTVEIEFGYSKILAEGTTAIHFLESYKSTIALLNGKYNNTVPIINFLGGEDKSKLSKFMHDISLLEKDLNLNFSEAVIAHNSIGEGTTEQPITEGMAFDPQFIKGIPHGAGHAIETSIEPFKNSVHMRNCTRQEFSKYLLEDNKYKEDALNALKTPLRDEATHIINSLKTEISKKNNLVDLILTYGGGSILMKPALKEDIENFAKMIRSKSYYIENEFSIFIEALGLLAFIKGERFKMLKEIAGK